MPAHIRNDLVYLTGLVAVIVAISVLYFPSMSEAFTSFTAPIYSVIKPFSDTIAVAITQIYSFAKSKIISAYHAPITTAISICVGFLIGWYLCAVFTTRCLFVLEKRVLKLEREKQQRDITMDEHRQRLEAVEHMLGVVGFWNPRP
ncbi:MAG: hypothetical protein Q9168_007114 [Polycauliona sp. 1 TL-2023]